MKIVYLLDRFPVLTQTFVLSEVLDHLHAAIIAIPATQPRLRPLWDGL